MSSTETTLAPGWIQTFTGRAFWPLRPRAEDVRIEDIAHALAMKCRFGGMTRQFYSVAQHSVLVSRIVPPADALWGLLHDAAEAYLPDVCRPIKDRVEFAMDGSAESFRRIESILLVAIAQKLMPGDLIYYPSSVASADSIALGPDHPPSWWATMDDPELKSGDEVAFVLEDQVPRYMGKLQAKVISCRRITADEAETHSKLVGWWRIEYSGNWDVVVIRQTVAQATKDVCI